MLTATTRLGKGAAKEARDLPALHMASGVPGQRAHSVTLPAIGRPDSSGALARELAIGVLILTAALAN